MRLHFAAVPVLDSAEAEDGLNAFLASHRVVAIERYLVTDGPRSVWAVCVSYTDGAHTANPPTPGRKERVDYKEVLDPATFAVFARLREARKALAERDGRPRRRPRRRRACLGLGPFPARGVVLPSAGQGCLPPSRRRGRR